MIRQLLLSSIFITLAIFGSLRAWGSNPGLDDPYQINYVKASVQDTLPPLQDRYEDFITNPTNNPFDLNDPAAVEQTIEYDPITGQYIVTERIGETLFRPPTYISFDEYMEITRQRDQKRYFDQLGGFNRGSSLSIDDPLAGVDVQSSLIDRLFGGNEINIQPQGSIDLTFGFDYQYVENPILTQRQKRNGGFDFDMAIQMNVTGQIGEKLKLSTNYNTQATFNFDNQIKIDYNSDLYGEDDILKKIEAGNVSLPLRGQLIQGAQSLFGLKTELQFGHLRLTAIASQQQSENENITIQGGSQVTEYEVKSDEYDENRHFFISHYNRATFEPALTNLPQINTLFHLENLEVWVTNDRNDVEDTRDIVAFADLGEPERLTNPAEIQAQTDPRYREICDGRPLPDNSANDLYDRITANEELQNIDRAVAILQSSQFNLRQSIDFEKVRARKLSARDYTVHPELGFISLNIQLQPDQVLAVSYTYKYNGEPFAVGTSSINRADVTTDTTQTSTVLFTKMLKSTTQQVDVPAWDLMMKNVYSIGAYQVNQEDFRLDIFYDDPGRGVKRFLPKSNLAGVPLVRVFNLDRLNVQGDPQPDGIFDFVPGVTINPSNGRIIFPVLEPFGSYLAGEIEGAIRDSFVYQELYDEIVFDAREFPEKNRYVIKGTYKSSVASELSLGAFNIPPGSERVTAGGQLLIAGQDYDIDYSTGRIRILNDAILSSGVPINVSFEDNTVFGLQNKTMIGLRADYEVNENVNIGATFLNLFERPFTPKVNFGDDPINNRIYGLDFNMSKDAPFLTRLVDKLPFYSTTEPSSISIMAEAAALDPGHSRAINQSRDDKSGIVYVDDFEGSASTIDLRQPTNQWYLASVPQGQPTKFPEANRGGLVSGANRARLNWYRIDPLARTSQDNSDPYTSLVPQNEIFPNLFIQPNQRSDVQVFDLSYFPNQRGAYNFDIPGGREGLTAGVQASATDSLSPVQLNDPDTRWGGIMRAITTNDFQTSNIEFVEFWMLSPFLDPSNPTQADPDYENKQGNLYFNLGNVSEDILQDSRRFFENGLPGPANQERPVDNTVWGKVPVGQQITRAFDNDPETRALQDVGLDGLTDEEEEDFYSGYLNAIGTLNPQAANLLRRDVANDNFRFYNDGFGSNDRLRDRYRQFNNPEGNSGANQGTQLRQSGTNIPDAEDLDADNTLNETESYYEYTIPIYADPTNPREIDRERALYITDRIEDQTSDRIWYRFRVPLRQEEKPGVFDAINGIQNFRSIRFMRMYMKGFSAPTILRFATLELVRNQWRRYTRDDIGYDGVLEPCETDGVNFQIDAVNIEENGNKQPFNYTLPLGIQREQSLGVFNALQNEQSLALRIDKLCDGAVQSVFKYTEVDMRLYERLQMFVHAEERNQVTVPDDALSMFIRLGSDFSSNYYEYEIPLKMSRPGAVSSDANPNSPAYKAEVWRGQNQFDFPLEVLKNLKVERNDVEFNEAEEYTQVYVSEGEDGLQGIHNIKVRGNPNLGFVKVMMIGIRNPLVDGDAYAGAEYPVEVWANELRLTGLNEKGGLAAIGRMDMQLADLGSVTVAGNYNSIGFGALDNGVMERSREQITGYDIAADVNIDKFFPDEWGLRIPFYAQRSNTTSTPEFDPYDLDIRLKDKLDATESATARDSIREQAQDITNRVVYNFSNVGIERSGDNGGAKPKPWDIENFSASYNYTRTEQSDPLILNDTREEYAGGIDYAYSRPTNYLQPFKGIKSKPLRIIKEFNLNPLPNSFSFSTVLDRSFSRTQYRFSGVEERFNTFFNKSFLWNRNYDLNWDLTRSLKFNFNANTNAAIDEPDEIAALEDPTITDIDQFRKDSIWTNIRNLGRPKLYEHNVSLSYTLPIRYLPYMDWVQVRAQYQGGYAWNAASLNVDSLGNVIQNSQNRQLNADLNFDKLYDQVPFLKKINRPARPSRNSGRTPSGRNNTGKDEEVADGNGGRKKRDGEISPITRALVRPLLLIRKGRLTYSENMRTVVPGFTPQTELLGLSSGFDAPGWGFVAGLQPKIRTLTNAEREAANAGNPVSDDWLYQNREWITQNVFLNQDVIQEYTQNYEGRITIEPFQDFRLEIEGSRSFTENYTESFKIFDKENPDVDFEHRIPNVGGRLTVSYNALSTMFQSSTEDLKSLFDTFEGYRPIISQRLGSGIHEDPDLAAEGYTSGFGRNQQDVLIPAFIAAYSGEDPNTIDLDPFNTSWKPNWRLTYNGLSKLKAFRDIFSSFNISHGYKSTFAISNYETSLYYLRALRENPTAGGIDQETFDFFPRIEVPDVVIQENFAPLFAIDMTFQNGMSMNFDYKQARTLALNITGKQLLQTRSSEIATGFGYRMSGVNIGFLTGNKKKKGRGSADEPDPDTTAPGGRPRQNRAGGRLNTNDLDFQFNFSYRDDLTVTQKLDSDIFEPTRGSLSINLSPSAEYQLNKNLSLRLFVDYRRTIPRTSAGFPRTDASGGVVVRFQLN
ncbi:cell surface protein SprA [Lewinella cohaerens]|uniref:T9SS outer membrane translocon Sov/SprA n=1 Tax=Lewinella cohaerens TaxID=70995 RepID=UPI000362EC23|nr:cell surface protein SprA [Lewinella cohaerens]